MSNKLSEILNSLLAGDLSVLTTDNIRLINTSALNVLNGSISGMDVVEPILKISNILWDNTDRDLLPLEDGIYDLLSVWYFNKTGNRIIGSPPVDFKQSTMTSFVTSETSPISFLKDTEEMIFFEDLNKQAPIDMKFMRRSPISMPETDKTYITKRLNTNIHNTPELVGTLDKSKFVLNYQAEEKGVINDSNVRILERDFFMKHIAAGVYDPTRILNVIVELKYDGVSVEGSVSNRILAAGTRGDVSDGVASDLTPIFEGYPFKNALGVIPDNNIFGMKFEAIITKYNIGRLNAIKGKDYKNCRTAIVGALSSSEAREYRDLITLVPLQTSLNIDRLSEVVFLNKYYANDEYLRYAVITGDYVSILFKIKTFLEEAEYMRPFLPFMYDGIVVSYLDEDIRSTLGRKGFVNQYSEAVKFNPLVKQTIFNGYSYTVGQDRSITPMIHYNPVEFFGTIHPNSTGHSYARFKALGLREGDIIDVEHTNDVMPYVTKPDNSHNKNNPNPIVEFTKECPVCYSELMISPTGKTIYCTNIDCGGAKIARVVNMMDKLNFKDFGVESLLKINKYRFNELMEVTYDELKKVFPGEKLAQKFLDQVNSFKNTPIYDYQIVGSLGFTNMGKSTWKSIFKQFTLSEILKMHKQILYDYLIMINGIGTSKASTIIDELDYFKDDLEYINNMTNIVDSKFNNTGKKIRFTGCRDAELVSELNNLGHDVGEGSVTKDTDILVVPYEGYSEGSKVSKAKKLGTIKIIPLLELKNNKHKYLE